MTRCANCLKSGEMYSVQGMDMSSETATPRTVSLCGECLHSVHAPAILSRCRPRLGTLRQGLKRVEHIQPDGRAS